MIKSVLLNKLVGLLTSRRFIVFVTGVATTFLQEQLGLTPEQAMSIVALASTWIFGDSLRSTTVLGKRGLAE